MPLKGGVLCVVGVCILRNIFTSIHETGTPFEGWCQCCRIVSLQRVTLSKSKTDVGTIENMVPSIWADGKDGIDGGIACHDLVAVARC